MSGLNHGWDKDEKNHADFIHGGVPIKDFDEEFRYKKAARSNWRGKRTRPCKKSKDKLPCDFSVPVVTWKMYSEHTKRWHFHKVWTCSRCGKHGQYQFGTSASPPG